MRTLDSSHKQLNAFLRRLAAAPARALLLDYDGTLAPFHVQRDQAVPYPGLREILSDLQAAEHTRLVIVSGRYSKDLLPLLGLENPPEIWGSHGWERRYPDGRTEIGHMDPAALKGLAEADDWVEAQELTDRCEQKPGCLALHLRGLPRRAAAALREKILDAWRDIAWRTGLDLTEFDGGIELRVPGRTKGDAVRTVLSELPDGAAVAYLGDDRTDEDAFETLGQRGLSVLVRPEFRPSAAGVWLKPPEQLSEFLRRWDEATQNGRSHDP
jgi:trehalose-phosphatase